MAITENTFSASELVEAIKANPELIPVLKGVAIDNETVKNALEPAFISDYTKRQAEIVEKKIKDLTGMEKLNPNERYYDLVERVLSAKVGELQKVSDELKTLREKGNPSKADQDRIKQLETELQTKDAQWKEKVEAAEARVKDMAVQAHIKEGLSELRGRYLKNLPPSLVALAEKNAIESLSKMAELQSDGTVTFKDEKGEVILNKQGDYKPTGAKSLLESGPLKELLETGKEQPGGGSSKDSQGRQEGGKTPGKPEFTSWPAEVKTKTEASEYLLRLGFTDDSEDFAKHFETLPKDMPLK